MLDILAQNPLYFMILLGALVFSVTIHEFAHAWVADRLGDTTARSLGRLTLNPRSHIDPFGLIFLIVAGFGWGRPVPYNPFNLKNPKRDSALIALAGPGSNFVMAILLAAILHFVSPSTFVGAVLYLLALYNLMLGVFNLMPFHPLDGFKIVGGFLPGSLAVQWYQMQSYGLLILMVFVVTGSFGKIITPIVDLLTKILGISL